MARPCSRGRVVRWAWLPALLIAFSAWARADAPTPLLLAERYRAGVEVADYWVSEKLDGVRAYWDGRQLRFRSGRLIRAPDWFLAGLPRRSLDGELWLGRGRFNALSARVRRDTPNDREWRSIHYMVFELPDASGSFSERLAALTALVAATKTPWLRTVAQFRMPNEAALQARLDAVCRAGGEGLMLHRADATYATGRSDVLLKLTPWLDAEARVVGHVPGRGRLAGMTGALVVEADDGRRFSLGSGLSDATRRAPPPIGSTVTYRYRELTPAGLPRFPRFLRLRAPE